MKLRYIPAFITLTAGTVTCLISIIKKFEVLYSLKALLLILVIFYIIGCIARSIIVNVTRKTTVEDEDDMKLVTNHENGTSSETNSAEESEATASTQ